VCVGHSACDDGWEALALLDPKCNETDEEAPIAAATIAALSDTPAADSYNSNNTNNGDSMAVASSATTATNSITTTNTASVPTTADLTSDANVDESTQTGSSSLQNQAHIVLQRHAEKPLLSPQNELCLSLDFRPIALTVGMIQLHNNNEPKETVPVVWCGSADTCKLYCFVYHKLGGGESDSTILQSLPLPRDIEAFQFTSPVMAVDYVTFDNDRIEDTTWSCLAVACQDGTVNLIHFTAVSSIEKDTSTWIDLRSTTVIVDGPLVCIHLCFNSHNGSLTALVGSLCGYVMCMSCATKTLGGEGDGMPLWKGPTMVAEGLWNSHLSSEDLDMAVRVFDDDIIAIGSHSGRCFLYQQQQRLEEPVTQASRGHNAVRNKRTRHFNASGNVGCPIQFTPSVGGTMRMSVVLAVSASW
jgi:hypothetical protein